MEFPTTEYQTLGCLVQSIDCGCFLLEWWAFDFVPLNKLAITECFINAGCRKKLSLGVAPRLHNCRKNG
jgi:hypothetical protein